MTLARGAEGVERQGGGRQPAEVVHLEAGILDAPRDRAEDTCDRGRRSWGEDSLAMLIGSPVFCVAISRA